MSSVVYALYSHTFSADLCSRTTPNVGHADMSPCACAQTCVQRSDAGSAMCLIGCTAEVKKVTQRDSAPCNEQDLLATSPPYSGGDRSTCQAVVGPASSHAHNNAVSLVRRGFRCGNTGGALELVFADHLSVSKQWPL
jgi:hypothetical protein